MARIIRCDVHRFYPCEKSTFHHTVIELVGGYIYDDNRSYPTIAAWEESCKAEYACSHQCEAYVYINSVSPFEEETIRLAAENNN
jgi:hypothetical protein